MKGIKESREVVFALSTLAIRLIDDLKDSKISLGEGLAFLSDFGIIRDGIQGIAQVPGELADLTEEERDLILADIRTALVASGMSHRMGDAAERILRWAHGTVRTFVEIRSLPLSAELASTIGHDVPGGPGDVI
jgi:hypothetical protein